MKWFRSAVTVFVSVLFAAMPHPGFSAEASALSWEECVSAAMTGNPDLTAAREKFEQAGAAAGVSRSGFLPQLSANAAGARSRSETDAGSRTADSYSYAIEGKQLIFDGLKSVYDYKGALAAVDSAKLDYIAVSASVRLSLRVAFVGLLQAQRSLDLARDIETVRRRNLELVRVKYEAGSEHRGAFLTAKADHAQALSDIRSAERSLVLARNSLCSVMGRPSSVFTAKGELVYDDRSGDAPSFASLAKDHPSVRKAGITRESARLAVRSAQLSNSPAIYGTGSYGRQGSALSSMKDRWSVGISASVSLFEGGASYYGVKKAAAQLRQAESDEASTRSAAAVSIEKAWNALRDSVADAAVKEEYLRAETEREKIAEARYSIGRMTFDDWTVIESGYVKAKQSLLASQAAVLTAEAAWIQSIGGPLEHETQK